MIQQRGPGKAGAIETAADYVTTPFMLVMDGDYTYDPSGIQRFLAHVNGYDQIIGARNQDNISRLHKFGNRMISRLFNTLFGTTISDVCSGMYLLNTKSARQLQFQTKGFSVEVEVLAQMALQGMITEVPINYRKRIGQPKLSTLTHGFDIFRSIFGLARQYNPIFIFSTLAASAAIPGAAILGWVMWEWAETHMFHGMWAAAGGGLLFLSVQAFIVGTIALLLKRSELRIEQLFRNEHAPAEQSVFDSR